MRIPRPEADVKNTPLILRIYCICAILILGWYGVVILGDVRGMQGETDTLELEIDRLSTLDVAAGNRYSDLEGKQRRERGSYTGQEAVMASVAVMDAKAEYEQLHLELEAAKARHATLLTAAANLQLRIVPVVAIALLHLFGIFMIRTERPSQNPGRR
jgi:hypothetical protein